MLHRRKAKVRLNSHSIVTELDIPRVVDVVQGLVLDSQIGTPAVDHPKVIQKTQRKVEEKKKFKESKKRESRAEL
jgi:hypothetical protein